MSSTNFIGHNLISYLGVAEAAASAWLAHYPKESLDLQNILPCGTSQDSKYHVLCCAYAGASASSISGRNGVGSRYWQRFETSVSSSQEVYVPSPEHMQGGPALDIALLPADGLFPASRWLLPK